MRTCPSTRKGDDSLILQVGSESWQVGWEVEAGGARTPAPSGLLHSPGCVSGAEGRWRLGDKFL